MNEINQQIQRLKQILQNEPNNLNVLLQLAVRYKTLENYEESLNYVLRAQQLDDQNETVIANLGVIYYKMGKLDLAKKSFDEVIRKNPTFITAYIHNALVQIEYCNPDKALQYLYKAQELFKDNNKQYKEKLALSHQKFIVQHLHKIVELEEQIQAQSMILISSFNSLEPQQQQSQENQEQFQILKNSINSVFKGAGEQLEKISEYFSEFQSSNKESSNNLFTSTKIEEESFSQNQNQLNNQFYNDFLKLKLQVENNTKRIEQIEQFGTKDKQDLRNGWINLEQHPDRLEYAQLFFFTLFHQFESYCLSRAGVFQINSDHFTSEESQRKYAIAQLTTKTLEFLLSKIPFIKEICQGINVAVDQIYLKHQKKQVNDRITAITEIIMMNRDPKFKTTEDQQICIALAAVELAKKKKNIFEIGQMEEENGTIAKIFNYFKFMVEKVSGPKITQIQQEVFDDIVILIAYMQENYKKIIEESQNKSMKEMIVNCIINKKEIEI